MATLKDFIALLDDNRRYGLINHEIVAIGLTPGRLL